MVFSSAVFSQKKMGSCLVLSKIDSLLNKRHFAPKPINDSLSVYVFDKLIDHLDENHSLFTKNEFEKLCVNRLQIDNFINDRDCNFLEDIVSQYKIGLIRKKNILEKFQNSTLDYYINDTLKYTKKTAAFDLLETNLEKVYNKKIRFEVLDDIASLSKNLDSLKLNFILLEKNASKKILETEICKIETILNSKNGILFDLKSKFLDLFCSYFDPHSSYFSYDDKSSFLSSLSTSNFSLGMDVTLNDNDEIIIGDIVPGGPAYKTKKLEKGDNIIEVGILDGENYKVTCSSLDKIGDIVFADTYKNLILTVQKKNGKIIVVSIQKLLMDEEENTIESFIIQNDIRVGYLKIPSFYSDYEGNTSKGCSQDVAKTIAKLEKENIEGLIIDLEDNGGGSMEEAEIMAGMFVNSGPISIFVDQKNNQEIVRDYNKGSIYSGPIVVLINGNTASASEFFTSAMQDYNRAIIIGSKSYGKATMQSIIPIEEKNEKEFVKVTTQKFYRITGQSHQFSGIIPDIIIPNLFDSLTERENKFETAFQNDSLVANVRYTISAKKNKERAIKLSDQRVKINERFLEINDLNKQIEAVIFNTDKMLKLDFETVFNQYHISDGLYNRIKVSSEKENNFQVLNIASKTKLFKKNPYKRDINDFNIKSVKSNPYVEESLNIIRDLNKI